MKDQTAKLLDLCSRVNFGKVEITPAQSVFYNELNEQILHLCKSLPESVQTDALLLFLKDHRATFSENTEFFRHYLNPSWSIVYWLTEVGHRRQNLSELDRRLAVEAHAMAMFLHAIDDHLHDGELAVSHLMLLIRSQAWLKMSNALQHLASGLPDGPHIISDFIDRYYSSIDLTFENKSLDQYCDIFRSQMATAYTVPGLLVKKISGDISFYSDALSAYGSFGIAWRLLDDLNDIQQDMVNNIHSAVYCCLSDPYKTVWDRVGEGEFETKADILAISDHILTHNIFDDIVDRILCELESAAVVADDIDLNGLAAEFRLMAKPFTSTVRL